MRGNILKFAVSAMSVLFIIPVSRAVAQEHRPMHLSGLINDYSPLNATVKGSPWEMHGQWSLDVHEDTGTADFAADLTMSGFGKTVAGAVDPTQPLQNPHTHHIQLTKAKITWDMTGCPEYLPPATKMGFQFTETVSLMTGNGSIAPFETDPPSSTVQVCVTGGDDGQYSVTNSNITLVFAGPAATHFGSQAVHGVVRKGTIDDLERHREDRR